jgi:hypothetical protein
MTLMPLPGHLDKGVELDALALLLIRQTHE